MRFSFPTRPIFAAALLLALALPGCTHAQVLVPGPRPMRRVLRAGPVLLAQQGQQSPAGPGLPQWFEQHRNLPPAEQERALQNDPSFRSATPQQQQVMLNQLRRLQAMTPQQLNRRWAFLRMTPAQREQFNVVMQQYAALPPPRQLMVRRALAAMRAVPPAQRQAAMATYPPLRRFSPYERQLLTNLLFWEPYLTGDPNAAPDQGR